MTPAQVLADDIHAPFSARRFALPRAPVTLRRIERPFRGDLPCCLDMLVRLPGGELVLPEPYRSCSAIRDFVELALHYETHLNRLWPRCHAYLTVDQRVVPSGRTHRNAGWHFDGMQGSRYPQKLPACHQYLVTDALGMEFFCGALDASALDEVRDNWFSALGAQAERQLEAGADERRAPQRLWAVPFEVVVMSAYQLHRSPRALVSTRRTFVRLDISHKEQDRLGNSRNPDLPAPWRFEPRALPEGLGQPVADAGWPAGAATRFGEP